MAYGLVLHPSLTSAHPSVRSFLFVSFPSFYPSCCAFAYVWGRGKVFLQIPHDIRGKRVCCGLSPALCSDSEQLVCSFNWQFCRGKIFLDKWSLSVHALTRHKKVARKSVRIILRFYDFEDFCFTQLHLTWGKRQGPGFLCLDSMVLEVFINLCDSTLVLWALALVQKHRTRGM